VTTLGIQHADGANATNGTTSFLEHEGGIDSPGIIQTAQCGCWV
jgi:hypothetical protein